LFKRGQYVSQQSETNIKHIKLDSAQTLNSVNEHVAFVEECQCPAGYTGLSCEVSVKCINNTIESMKNIY
jgi:hypothetical protein